MFHHGTNSGRARILSQVSGSRVHAVTLSITVCPEQRFSKCGPQISITWQLVRNTHSLAQTRPPEQETLGVSPVSLFESLIGDSDVLKFLKHWSESGMTIRHICKMVHIWCALYSHIFIFTTIHWVRQWMHFNFTNEETNLENQSNKEETQAQVFLMQIPGISTIIQLHS